jgi:hypothetical protein
LPTKLGMASLRQTKKLRASTAGHDPLGAGKRHGLGLCERI